ncbi:DUF4360 domain-containing protein [Actinomadura syzygii]|uniref:DUF4360 domain-containing protein n=1 Tax=Actinomadura syzygii TaxID=1427538 RepID=UPI0016524676|nr:DUF4360 domain-containing protein [Actinomadura syzygii]
MTLNGVKVNLRAASVQAVGEHPDRRVDASSVAETGVPQVKRNRMRKRLVLSVVSAAALAATVASVPPAAAGPRLVPGPWHLTIKVRESSGPGCPKGAVRAYADVDDDAYHEGFTVVYDNYIAQAGGSSRPEMARQSCQVTLGVRGSDPYTYTYAISSVDYEGSAYLQNGAKAFVSAAHNFQGYDREPVSFSFNGPYDANWKVTHQTPEERLVFLPCGQERYVVLTTELRVAPLTSDPSKVSFISMDGGDSSLRTDYHLSWKRCP